MATSTPPVPVVDLTKLVGPAHPLIKAVVPVTLKLVPVYNYDPAGKVGGFAIIKNNEIRGPFGDVYVARDHAQLLIQNDIEHTGSVKGL